MKKICGFLLILTVGISALPLFQGCSRPAAATADQTPSVRTGSEAVSGGDYWPGKRWRTSAPENQGMDSGKLLGMLNYIRDGQKAVHSIVIIRNGYLVMDADFFPNKSDAGHVINSCTKSITSAIFGIAAGEGLIKGTDQKVLDYFADRSIQNMDERKKALSLEHLLTMTAGFEWREDGSYDSNDSWVRTIMNTDPVGYILDKPMSEAPGTGFYYNTGASHLLSAVLQKATGKKIGGYAREKLFEPLGIGDVYWQEDATGLNDGGGGIRMSPLDMARFGYLFLRDGRWNNVRIVPESWVKEATAKHVDTPSGLAGRYGYGYQWWMNGFGGYSARGYGGQYIFVLPEYDIVAVFTAALQGSDFFLPESLTESFIIPAVKSAGPIEDEAGSSERLREKLEEIEKAA